MQFLPGIYSVRHRPSKVRQHVILSPDPFFATCNCTQGIHPKCSWYNYSSSLIVMACVVRGCACFREEWRS